MPEGTRTKYESLYSSSVSNFTLVDIHTVLHQPFTAFVYLLHKIQLFNTIFIVATLIAIIICPTQFTDRTGFQSYVMFFFFRLNVTTLIGTNIIQFLDGIYPITTEWLDNSLPDGEQSGGRHLKYGCAQMIVEVAQELMILIVMHFFVLAAITGVDIYNIIYSKDQHDPVLNVMFLIVILIVTVITRLLIGKLQKMSQELTSIIRSRQLSSIKDWIVDFNWHLVLYTRVNCSYKLCALLVIVIIIAITFYPQYLDVII